MRFRLPWTRRADAERDKRIAAERRLKAVRADWLPIREGVEAVQRTVELNDYTRKAREAFGGRR